MSIGGPDERRCAPLAMLMTRTSQDRQDVCDRRAKWLRITGQDVRPDKSGACALGALAGDAPAQLRGLEIPNKDEFRQLGVGIRVEARRGTSPSSRSRLIAPRPSFAASGASRCFASGLQRWALSRSPRL